MNTPSHLLMFFFVFISFLFQACTPKVDIDQILEKDKQIGKWIPVNDPNKGCFYVDSEGKKVLDLNRPYDQVYPFNGLALVRQGVLYGLIDETGKEVVPCNLLKPQQVLYCKNNPQLLRIQEVSKENLEQRNWENFRWQDHFIIYNRESKQTNAYYCKFPGIPANKAGPVRVRRNCMESRRNVVEFKETGKWGVLNEKLTEVIPFEYDLFYEFEGSFIGKKGKKWKVFDANGEVMTSYKCSSFQPISKDMNAFTVMNDKGLHGVINGKSELVIPMVMDDIQWGYIRGMNVLKLERNGKKGAADLEGNMLIPCEFDEIYEDAPELHKILLRKGGDIFSIEKNKINAQPVSTGFTDIQHLDNNEWLVAKGEKVGLLKRDSLIVAPKFDALTRLLIVDDIYYFALQKEGKWGIASKNQIDPVFSLEADSICSIYEDPHLKYSFPYEAAYLSFEENSPIAFAMRGGHWGLLGANGEIIGSIEYDKIESLFYHHLFKVQKGGKWGVLNSKGQIVMPLTESADFVIPLYGVEPDSIGDTWWNMKNNFWWRHIPWKEKPVVFVRKRGKWALMDTNGGLIGEPVYDAIKPVFYNLFKVKKNGKWGMIDEQGKVVIPISEPYNFGVYQDRIWEGFLFRSVLEKGLECHWLKEIGQDSLKYIHRLTNEMPDNKDCVCQNVDGYDLGLEYFGMQGAIGTDGASGPAGPPTGATGASGPAGATGAAGASGPTGKKPAKAPEPLGPPSPKASGPAGPDGNNGARGASGPAGPAGATGASGPAGPYGATGADGASGPAGPAGFTRSFGYFGPAGPAGALGFPYSIIAASPIGSSDPLVLQKSQTYTRLDEEIKQKRAEKRYNNTFEDLLFISDGAMFVKVKGKWGLFNPTKEKMRIYPKFDNLLATLSSSSFEIVAKQNGRWWLLNDCGEIEKRIQ